MPERYVFIDESGDLGERGSDYFVIGAIWTENVTLFERFVKNARRNKFKKVLRGAQELKANKSKKDLRNYVLESIACMDDVHCHAIVLHKKKLYSTYLKNNKHKLYNYVCGVLASTMSVDSKSLVIRIDRSQGKQALQRDFNQYLKKKIKERKWNARIAVHHSWSHGWPGLQMADFVAWSVFQKFENSDDSYFTRIENITNINHVYK
ncbi:MAG: DUF3800 domain-containing protein [Candidatus Woesearchaeota archaeon]|nr:DUF3800 domain-containing protein [Candidatus Woesearchaeota archaeon]